ncbi:MAG TPA: carbohydrate-binding protein, partial [Tichowtungia sp.]|nr:carbohydrate-binding protein [Tichowtungia sp.]
MKSLILCLLSAFSLSTVGFTNLKPYYTAHIEAETAAMNGGSRIENKYFPHVGRGYVTLPQQSSTVEWKTIRVPHAGKYTLLIKYANGSNEERPCQLEVNGAVVETLPFAPVYSDWHHYWNVRAAVELREGDNVIRLIAVTGRGGPNIDNIAVSSDTIAVPPGEGFDVRAFGAKGDGSTDDTKAIQAAIDACTPGGSVVLSDGVFMSGQIRLKSDMTLWIDKTATLRAIQKAELFPNADPPSNNVSVADELGQAFVYSQGADNLTITGGGTLDGNGECEIWNREKDES